LIQWLPVATWDGKIIAERKMNQNEGENDDTEAKKGMCDSLKSINQIFEFKAANRSQVPRSKFVAGHHLQVACRWDNKKNNREKVDGNEKNINIK
jgi:hypothetical protein